MQRKTKTCQTTVVCRIHIKCYTKKTHWNFLPFSFACAVSFIWFRFYEFNSLKRTQSGLNSFRLRNNESSMCVHAKYGVTSQKVIWCTFIEKFMRCKVTVRMSTRVKIRRLFLWESARKWERKNSHFYLIQIYLKMNNNK